MFALSLVGWLVFALLLMSLIEYAAHRWPMHSRPFVRRFPFLWRTFEAHAVLHHGRFYRKDFSYDADPAANHINIDLSIGFNVLGLAIVWVPLLLVSPLGGLTLAAVAGLHALVWSVVHREMHDAKGRWYASNAYFRYLAAYHHTHHLNPGTNFHAVLPPLWDVVFRTYRKPVPPVPGMP